MIFALAAAALGLAGCGDNQTHPSPDHDPYSDAGDAPLACVPNLDGTITMDEMKATLGVPVKYLVSAPGSKSPVDVVGTVDDSGKRTWDWSADVASDKTVSLVASTLDGKWYAASFPNGKFVTAMDAAGSLEGVYSQDEKTFYLHGIASTEKDPKAGRTLLVYEPAIALYEYPLTVGKTWVSAGQVKNGTIKGLPYAGKDIYEVKDDATGQLVLHDVTFSQVHRIRTKVTLSPATGAALVTRQVSFLFECFGEVARATSQNDETKDDFTTASEVRRLGL
jgi:hypothetical protein